MGLPQDISAVHEDEKMGIGEAQALARRVLGEAAYRAALAQGATMDDDRVVGYAQDEFPRLAARHHTSNRPIRKPADP